MTTLYKKEGRRYVPVHDTAAYDGLPNGSWLVVVGDGRRSCREIEPDFAAWAAAAEAARDAMLEALRKASDCRPRDDLTAREKRAYEAWREVMGEKTMWLTRDSAWDVVRAGIDAVKAKAKANGGGKAE